MRLIGSAILLALIAGSAVAEDRLVLTDGQVITGTIVSIDRRDVRIRTDLETLRVPRIVIETMEREDGAQAGSKTLTPFRAFPAATPELQAWMEVCAEHLGSEDEGVRAGAAAALRVAGPAARAVLEKIVAESEDAPRPVVTRLLDQIDRLEGQTEPSRPR